MKKIEIKVGGTYADGKGGVREVIAEGDEFALVGASQANRDCIRFRVVAKARGPHEVGKEYNTTRRSFAWWAKSLA
jgi:hypothetical protein